MSYFSSLKLQDGASTWNAFVDPIGALKTSEANRLTGNNFGSSTFDTNIWTSTLAAAGTIAQANNVLTSKTGTSANGSSSFTSNRVARFNYGAVNVYRGTHRFATAGTANNVRQFGAYNPTTGNGYLFRLSGSTFQIVTVVATVETVVNNGSFNGNGLATGLFWTFDTNAHSFTIRYTVGGADFLIDDVVIHTILSTSAPLSGGLTLPIHVSNVNSGGSTTDVTLETWAAVIYRLGTIYNNPLNSRITGATTATVKYSAGLLNYIVICNPGVNGDITFYDNTAGSGTVIMKLVTNGSNQIMTLPVDIQFNTALTVVTTGAGQDIVISYE